MISRSLASIGLLLAVPTASGAEAPSMPAMSSYQFGLLRKGPAWTATRTSTTDSLQAGHMANIGRMANEGFLVGAGPLLDGGDLRGVFVFRADSVARLREQVARDPAVRAGRLVMDLHAWSAPSGIGEPYVRMAARPGHRDSMMRVQLVLLKKGPKWTAASTQETQALQAAHLRSIFGALATGELASAGPFAGEGPLRGVLVYRGDSTFAIRRALEDPAVEAGQLAVEMHPWFVAYGTWPGDTLGPGR